MQEVPITFHVTVESDEQAELYQQKILRVLDENQDRFEDPDSDCGAVCSGHVGCNLTV